MDAGHVFEGDLLSALPTAGDLNPERSGWEPYDESRYSPAERTEVAGGCHAYADHKLKSSLLEEESAMYRTGAPSQRACPVASQCP